MTKLPLLRGIEILSQKIINVKGTPYEMGKQHGDQLKSLVKKFSENTKLSYKNMGLSGNSLNKILETNINYFREIAPNLIKEMEGIADGANMNFEEVFAANFCGEISCAQPPKLTPEELTLKEKGCSTFVATKNATVGNNDFIAFNLDTNPNTAKFRPIIIAEPLRGLKYIAVSRVTDNGGYGINEKGVAIMAPTVRCWDSIEAFSSGKPSGVYDRALCRKVLSECSDLDEALEVLKIMPGPYQGLNILLMDGNGDIAKVELSYNNINIIYPDVDAVYAENYVMAATNHFSSKKTNQIGPKRRQAMLGSYIRYERIKGLLIQNAGKIDFELFKTFTRDHANDPDSLCRHRENVKLGEIEKCTIGSVIAQSQLALKRLWVLHGTPCENEYTPYII